MSPGEPALAYACAAEVPSLFLQDLAQSVEALFPQRPLLTSPILYCLEAVGIQLALAHASCLFRHDETAVLQNLQVLTHRREGDAQRAGKSGHRLRPHDQCLDDGAARFVSQRVKHQVNGDIRMRNVLEQWRLQSA